MENTFKFIFNNNSKREDDCFLHVCIVPNFLRDPKTHKNLVLNAKDMENGVSAINFTVRKQPISIQVRQIDFLLLIESNKYFRFCLNFSKHIAIIILNLRSFHPLVCKKLLSSPPHPLSGPGGAIPSRIPDTFACPRMSPES